MRSKEYGFGVIDSIVALALLSTVILGIIYFNKMNTQKKQAKQLADQTEAYTQIFAQYMNLKHSDIRSAAITGTYTLSPQSLGINWPSSLSTKNLFGQTPCIGITVNPNTGNLEAILYYVLNQNSANNIPLTVINNTSIILGNKGGILKNGVVKGNSGWSINANSEFFAGVSQCGNKIADNSIVINIDLVSDWNHDLEPATSINKELDKGNQSDEQTLPGHMLNSNTSKSNVNFANTKGVILNSDPNNMVKLSIQDNGATTASPTIGFGSNAISTINADTIQATQQNKAGDPCQVSEIGKTVSDVGSDFPDAAKVLARNTLVCSKNDMICARTSVSHTCYLPSSPNSIIYQNSDQGIQDNSGSFNCPAAVPFASNPITGGGDSNGYYYATNLDDSIGCVYAKDTDGGCFRPGHAVNQCPLPFTYSSGCGGYAGPSLLEFGAQPVSGPMHAFSFKNVGGQVQVTPIVGQLGSYQTTVGYTINITPINLDCGSVCTQLPPTNSWESVTTNPSFNHQTFPSSNSCGCWIFSNNTANAIAIAVLQKPQAILKSVTCSNMPIYKAQ